MDSKYSSGEQIPFANLLATMVQLRDPQGGCPWDIEQTHGSLRHALLEECYEALEALDSSSTTNVVEELGDLLIQIVFHAEIGRGEGTFNIEDIICEATNKLHRRHPHVFGSADVKSSEEVKHQWEKIKEEERKVSGKSSESAYDGIPRTLPALAYAQTVQSRASRRGIALLSDKPLEEQKIAGTTERDFGELLFSVVDAARRAGVEAESALRNVNQEFYERVSHLESESRLS